MNGGRIEQIGTPDEVYHAPASLFVAGFIGAPTMNLLPARFERPDALRFGEENVIPLQQKGNGAMDVVLGIRPEDVDIASGAPPPGCADVTATVEVVEPLGADTLIFTRVFGGSITARVRRGRHPPPGSQIKLRMNLERTHLFDAVTGKALVASAH